MGCGASSEEIQAQNAVSKEIDKAIRTEHKADKRVKILLLGSGSSGKSTLAKQMKLLYMSGFSDKETAVFTDVVFLNILKNMKALVLAADRFEISLAADNSKVAQHLRDMTIQLSDVDLTDEMAKGISNLWRDPGIRAALERASEFQLDDSAPYFFDNLERVSQSNYRPTDEDILHLRARTIGIVETCFTYQKKDILMVDVGGQKNERKKWIHCFQDVTAIIFVVACSDYDLLLEEDMATNRMQDSLKLFNDVVNNKWFSRTNVVLFLNKKDLFAQKIAKIPLTKAFPDYKGKNDYDSGMAHILAEFKKIDKSPPDTRQIFHHQTCATDTQNVKIVFEAVTLSLLSSALEIGGFE